MIHQLVPHLTRGTYAVHKLSGLDRLSTKSKEKEKRSSEPLLIRIMQTKEGLKLGLVCLKHGREKVHYLFFFPVFLVYLKRQISERSLGLSLSTHLFLSDVYLLTSVDFRDTK